MSGWESPMKAPKLQGVTDRAVRPRKASDDLEHPVKPAGIGGM
jgi:hypothetical protein